MDGGWEPGFPLRCRAATPNVLVGEWTCPVAAVGLGPEERANHHEVWLQRAGSRTLQIGSERVVGDPSNAVFVHAEETVRPGYPAAARQHSTAILVTGEALREVVAEIGGGADRREDRLFAAPCVAVSSHASLLHHRLLRGLGAGENSALEVEETALALLRCLLAGSRPRRPARTGAARARRAGQELAEAVRHLLAHRYAEKLTLDDIGRAVSASPFHLTRTFAAETGIPVHRYLTRLRLRLALDLLAQRPRDLSWVALQSGFASHSHFATAFRAEYGVPPSAIARSARYG